MARRASRPQGIVRQNHRSRRRDGRPRARSRERSDGLASGLLAGVNPVAGLYGYLFGMLGGACFTGTAFMSVQATGAIIVADVDLAGREDPAKSLFTLSVVTGIVIHIWELDLATTTVGVVTIVLIVVLGRTPLGSLGLFVAVLAGSVLGRVVDALGSDVPSLNDIADVRRSLPLPTMPAFREMIGLSIPALSLAFVGHDATEWVRAHTDGAGAS